MIRRPRQSRGRSSLTVGVIILLSFAACADDGERRSADHGRGAAPPEDYRSRVDHPLVAFAQHKLKVFRGRERDSRTGEIAAIRSEARVLSRRGRVAGIPATVVDVREYEDGELVEHTVDYYAERRDGSVWYLGERVDDYEAGKVVGHEGQWFAGRSGARPGLFSGT